MAFETKNQLRCMVFLSNCRMSYRSIGSIFISSVKLLFCSRQMACIRALEAYCNYVQYKSTIQIHLQWFSSKMPEPIVCVMRI